eukprot:1733580-Alexandrium_andersonii.AAC.1
MSASLVGSEMCIRDRWPSASSKSARPTSSAAGAPQSSGRASRSGRFTVSYTHLTLPTICSV